MTKHAGIVVVLFTLVTSCAPKLHVARLKYNELQRFYTYPFRNSTIAIRNDSAQLITKTNLKPFLETLANRNFNYNFSTLSEQTFVISEKDAELLDLYSAMLAALKSRNTAAASFYISELRKAYPKIDCYSDILFFEGQLAALLADTTKQRNSYNKFLVYSEKKFPGLFRGYVHNDSVQKQFVVEREIAQNFINNNKLFNVLATPVIPQKKFYYESFSKGFVLNREDFNDNKSFLPAFALAYNNKTGFEGGAFLAWLKGENLCLSGQITYSKNQSRIIVSAPMQVIKTFNYRFGIKFSPMLNSSYLQKFEDGISAQRIFVNPGAALSMGYAILPRLFIGTSITGYYYNKSNSRMVLNHKLYNENELALSFQYLIIKGFSLRTDLINGRPVIGFGLSGSLLGLNLTSGNFGLFNRDY